MSTLIVIPARQASTRLPNKPLLDLCGHSLLARSVAIGRRAVSLLDDARLAVATDTVAIADAACDLGVEAILTPPALESGSARALAAYQMRCGDEHLIVNLQGDAVFTQPDHVVTIVRACLESRAEATTPAIRLGWDQLDALRAAKILSPSSGTTCICDESGRAIWFSKAIIPFLRNESSLRAAAPLSPVRQHLGLYCFRPATLTRMLSSPASGYELVEGLEQLRLIGLGADFRVVDVSAGPVMMGGIDTPEDMRRAQAEIAAYGDPYVSV